jgi:hypothetical protein
MTQIPESEWRQQTRALASILGSRRLWEQLPDSWVRVRIRSLSGETLQSDGSSRAHTPETSPQESSRGLAGTRCDSYIDGVLRSLCDRAGNRANLAAMAVQMTWADA